MEIDMKGQRDSERDHMVMFNVGLKIFIDIHVQLLTSVSRG